MDENLIKKVLKSLVISSPTTLTIEQLNRDYESFENKCIPFKQLGYNSLEFFLRSMSDAFIIRGFGKTAKVLAVPNPKTIHIQQMIMEQKMKSMRWRSRYRNDYQVDNSQISAGRGNFYQTFSNINRNVSYATPPRAGPVKQNSFHKTYTQFKPMETVETAAKQTVQHVQQKLSISSKTVQDGQLYSTVETGAKRTVQHVQQKLSISFKNDQKPDSVEINVKDTKQSEQTLTSSQMTDSPPLVPKRVKFIEKKDEPRIISKKDTVIDIPESINEDEFCIQRSNQLNCDVSGRSINLFYQPQDMKDGIEAAETEYEMNVNKFKEIIDINEAKLPNLGAAVPEFAMELKVLRADFPSFIVPFGHKIPSCTMPDSVTLGSCLALFLAEVHNPFKFWFHLYKEEESELDSLMDDLQDFYNPLEPDELSIPIKCLVPGQLCVAIFQGVWHRAEILQPPVNNTVKVWFFDYGTVDAVNITNIKLLATYFGDLPAQAFRGCLSHIKPCDNRWSFEATRHLLTMAEEETLFAKITEIDKENMVYYMILCNSSGEEVLQLNKDLVAKGYAVYNQDWDNNKVNENNGRRQHHPREDFPTFSMIESAKYPTFGELVELKELGIDYEKIHDSMMSNKSAILNLNENVPESIRRLPFYLLTSNPFRTDILFELTGVKSFD